MGITQQTPNHIASSTEQWRYAVALLDPRPQANNDALFEGTETYGIEVTVPQLAARCTLGNLDPQHTGTPFADAAIEKAVCIALPPVPSRLLTIRPDLDALGSMAIFEIRRNGDPLSADLLERVAKIAAADKFVRGKWPGVRPLPSRSNRWPEGRSELAAIARLAFDHKLVLADRVGAVQEWLIRGSSPDSYEVEVEQERDDLIEALESRMVQLKVCGRIAIVQGNHRSLVDLGYRLAPVVIAANPAFRLQGGIPHLKFTICQYESAYVRWEGLVQELRQRESGWGGSTTVIGSPQGVHSELSVHEVVGILRKHLL